MVIYVQLNSKEQLRHYITQDDAEYAQWFFDKHEVAGDILATVTPEQYEKLAADYRYRESCRLAAKRMECKAKHPEMFLDKYDAA